MNMNTLSMILAMAPTQGQGQQSGQMMSLVFLVLIIVIFYLFMIRPQMKRQKELTKYRNSLQKGDRVVTTGGIYGKVNDVKDNTVTLEIAPNVHIKVDKSAIIKDASDLSQQR